MNKAFSLVFGGVTVLLATVTYNSYAVRIDAVLASIVATHYLTNL